MTSSPPQTARRLHNFYSTQTTLLSQKRPIRQRTVGKPPNCSKNMTNIHTVKNILSTLATRYFCRGRPCTHIGVTCGDENEAALFKKAKQNTSSVQPKTISTGTKQATGLVLAVSSSVDAATGRHSDLQTYTREGLYLHFPVARHSI